MGFPTQTACQGACSPEAMREAARTNLADPGDGPTHTRIRWLSGSALIAAPNMLTA